MSKYNYEDIKIISNKLDDAIRAVIHLRRCDDYIPLTANIYNVKNDVDKKVQNVIDMIEQIYAYAENNDYQLLVMLSRTIAPSYNYLLDLCENKVFPSRFDAEQWDNKPKL